MIPLSHYNWFGEPPLKQKIRDVFMMTWILFLCPLTVVATVAVVVWGLSTFVGSSSISAEPHKLTWQNEVTDK